MDTNDEVFWILRDIVAPVVTVTHPNGGEIYAAGDTVDIEWTATDNVCVDSANIYLSEDGGIHYEELACREENDSIYRWVIPNEIGDICIVKVAAYDPSQLWAYDTSDAPFYITSVSTDVNDEGIPGYTNRLEQNYPNPFNGTTTIAYSVAVNCEVNVRVYDTAGKLVKVLEHSTRGPGRFVTVWRGTDDAGCAVASGVYFCSIDTGGFKDTRKIVYLK